MVTKSGCIRLKASFTKIIGPRSHGLLRQVHLIYQAAQLELTEFTRTSKHPTPLSGRKTCDL